MTKKLEEWLAQISEHLNQKGIETENIRRSPSECTDGGITVEQASNTCLGQISLWESGLMDVEIVDIETETRLLFKHFELEANPNFGNVLKEYFDIMQNGVVSK